MDTGGRFRPVALVGGVILALLIGIATRGMLEPGPRSGADEDEIKAAIENGILLMGEACLESSRGQAQYYKNSLASYWSDEPPTGDQLAERESRFKEVFPTADPTARAEIVATAQAMLDSGDTTVPTTTLLARINYVEPTASWDPGLSPLEEKWKQIDICQENAALPISFGLESITYEQIIIDGEQAEVLVEVSLYSDYELPDGTVRRSSETIEEVFTLEHDAGAWLIASEDYVYRGLP